MRNIDDYLIPASGVSCFADADSGGEEMKTAYFELSVPAGSVRIAEPGTEVIKARLTFWQRFWSRWFQRWDTPSVNDCSELLFSQTNKSIGDSNLIPRGTMLP